MLTGRRVDGCSAKKQNELLFRPNKPPVIINNTQLCSTVHVTIYIEVHEQCMTLETFLCKAL